MKAAVSIPVIANGDIDSPQKAKWVLDYTKADAVMIGRAAQGRPWIFRDTQHYFDAGELPPAPETREVMEALLRHLADHYAVYGEYTGVRSARKHIGWYVEGLPNGEDFRDRLNTIESTAAQHAAVETYFSQLADEHHRLPIAQYAWSGIRH